MKSTGMLRKIDALGRIVLPIEIRRSLGININDSVEICSENDSIILRKYQSSCIFCKNTSTFTYFMGKNICAKCVKDISIDPF